MWDRRLNTLRPRQNGRRFADDTFKRIFLNENVRISIKISLKFVPKGTINNNPALVQIMAWRRSGDKPLSEPMMVSLLTHICVTRPQCVKASFSDWWQCSRKAISPSDIAVDFALMSVDLFKIIKHIVWSSQNFFMMIKFKCLMIFFSLMVCSKYMDILSDDPQNFSWALWWKRFISYWVALTWMSLDCQYWFR